MEDRPDADAKKLKKLAPSDAYKKLVQEVINKLQEGMDAISEGPKHIRIADSSRFHWRTVEVLKAGRVGITEDEKKWVKEVERDLANQYSDRRRPSTEGRLLPS